MQIELRKFVPISGKNQVFLSTKKECLWKIYAESKLLRLPPPPSPITKFYVFGIIGSNSCVFREGYKMSINKNKSFRSFVEEKILSQNWM